MYSRLLYLAISMLPHNARQSLDNPVQWNRLPNHSGVELDYPVFQDTLAVAQRRTAVFLILVSLIGPLMWLDTALLDAFKLDYPILNGALKVFVFLVATFSLIFGSIGNRWPVAAFASAIFVIPIFAQLLIATSFTQAAILPVLFGIFFISNRLAVFFLYLNTAAPLSVHESRIARTNFHQRWFKFRNPMLGAEFYPLNFLVLLAPAAIINEQSYRRFNGQEPLSTTAIFVILTLFGLFWPSCLEMMTAPIYGRRSFSTRQMVRAFSRALVEWYTYNRLNSRGVGIHQSPAGNCRDRRILLTGVIFFWACLWIGSQPFSFRPPQKKGLPDPNAVAEQELSPLVDSIIRSNETNTVEPKPQPSEPELTSDERDVLDSMTPERRKAYYQMRSEFHRQQSRHREVGQKPAELLFTAFGLTFTLAVSVLVPTLATLLSVLAMIFGASARFLAGVEVAFSAEPRKRILSSDNWEFLVERVRNSRDVLEKNSIFMGTNAIDDTPVLIPRDVFKEHAHILGDSGSGKTSLGIMPLVSQLIRRGDSSIVVIDLKADDQALLETLRTEAAQVPTRNPDDDSKDRTYRCRWFTSALDRSSYIFNPLTQRIMARLPDYQRADMITAALGLQYGTDYGRKFYGDANFELLQYTLNSFPKVQSLAELSDALDDASSRLPRDFVRNASNVITSIRRLARCKAMNGCASRGTLQAVLDNAIDFGDVFETPQVLYFGLPPASGVSTTAEIARFAIYSLLGAAQLHSIKKRTQVYLVIDEFQRIVANNLALFLQTARSMGIGVILSNQSLTDLEAVDANLISAVRTNTRYRQIYGVGTREDIRDIRDTAGESLVGMRSWQILPQIFGGPAVQSMNVRETPVPRMMLNDILLATDAFGRCISCLRRGADYAQFGGMPFVMDTVHHIPRRKYTDLRVQDWPPANEGCPVSGLEDETQIKVIGGPLGRRPAIETSSDDETVPDTPAQTETTDAEEAESDWNSRMEQEAEKEELDRKEKKARRQRRKKLDDENDPEFPPEGIR